MDFIKEFKDSGGIGVALWVASAVLLIRWFVPKLEKWFEKHFVLIDTIQGKLEGDLRIRRDSESFHAATHKSLIHLANAVHGSAPDNVKTSIITHVEAIKRIIEELH